MPARDRREGDACARRARAATSSERRWHDASSSGSLSPPPRQTGPTVWITHRAGKSPAGRRLRVAGLAAAEQPALGENRRTAGAVDRPVDAAAAEQARVFAALTIASTDCVVMSPTDDLENRQALRQRPKIRPPRVKPRPNVPTAKPPIATPLRQVESRCQRPSASSSSSVAARRGAACAARRPPSDRGRGRRRSRSIARRPSQSLYSLLRRCQHASSTSRTSISGPATTPRSSARWPSWSRGSRPSWSSRAAT